ncbi:M48 family metallopeptidase [Bradyrhizobium guangdongense]|uniref:Protease HtpX homolog n=1 Tax=Bradyrhizobium guangdongense TaxID=1325090 RepID=A0A410VC51_9BRAD|nr:M48 family metallopeptidase [Bradyrhizobium guangdongense]QAU41200.1 peptidase M48 Ste24p [Bradyrhizobium guangdongense]QOZ62261.1 peptidase M48 Ste24p [Bradyrhizobium guangdongense]GGI26443.1 protease HtpX [Bradyrhizobium guangdongense]
MAAYGLYTHIASNKFRSMLLLAGLFALVYVLVFAGALVAEVVINGNGTVTYYLNQAFADLLKAAPFATIAAAAWIVIAYFFHQSMIDAVTGGHDVTRQEEPRLYNLLENLCISRGIIMPKLKIMESPALNAFATGLNPRQYSITVTTGLLDALDDQEIEAVLGHELTHIKNGDVQLMVVAVIIAGVVGFFGELFFRLFTNLSWNSGGSWSSGSSSSRSSSSSSDSKNSGGGAVIVIIIAVVLIVVAWLMSQVVKLALSRSREYLADAGSVELTKNPDAMISALRKIEGRGELPDATSAVMELCVDNPREGFADLFATHPSVQSRVDALVKFAGGHDPGPLPLPLPADETEQSAPDEPEAQGQQQDAPPPLPQGPWNDAGSRATPSSIPAPGASGTAGGNPLGPIGNPMGPWGRH